MTLQVKYDGHGALRRTSEHSASRVWRGSGAFLRDAPRSVAGVPNVGIRPSTEVDLNHTECWRHTQGPRRWCGGGFLFGRALGLRDVADEGAVVDDAGSELGADFVADLVVGEHRANALVFLCVSQGA